MSDGSRKEGKWLTEEKLKAGINKDGLPGTAGEAKVEGQPDDIPDIVLEPPQPDVPPDPNTSPSKESAMAKRMAKEFEDAGRPMKGAKDD